MKLIRRFSILAIVLGISPVLQLALGSFELHGETLLQRGTYLMQSIVACGNCHTPKGPKGQEISGMELAGGFNIVEEGIDAWTANITPDKTTGIGNWSDAQIINAIRNGKRPDGSTIGPPMPIEVYREISDRDARAIVAYLRSVKPVRNKVKPSKYAFPLPPSYGPPVTHVPEVSRSDPVKYGAYLAGPLGHCTVCHTPMEKGRFKFQTHLGAGGLPFHLPFGTVFSANITPHKKTGLGGWKDEEIKRAITKGINREGTKLYPPMPYPYFAKISAGDLDAIVAYLRSLKPVRAARKVRFKPSEG